MSKVVGDVAIRVGADTTSLVTGMRKSEASLATFAKVGVGAVAAVGAAMVALTKQSMANIDVLAKQARSLGLTTQAFQKMALVAEEAGVESGKLSDMLGKMQRNIDELGQGTQTQIDAFSRLGLSITDLQGLKPDEQFAKIAESLDAINDPTSKAALSMEVFGKSGRASINMLSDYSAKAAEAAEFQNRFGIAVSQTASDDVERANDAVGRLGMVMEGLGNRMATFVAPAIESVANSLIAFAANIWGANTRLEEFYGTLERARAILGDEIVDALNGNAAAIVDNAAALETLRSAYDTLAGTASNASNTLTQAAWRLEQLGELETAQTLENISTQMAVLNDNFEKGKIKGDEFASQMTILEQRAIEAAAGIEGIDAITFARVTQGLEFLGATLARVAAVAATVRNNLPGASAGMDTGSDFPGLDGGNSLPPDPRAPTTSPRPRQQGVDSLGDWAAAGAPKKGGGGGGGGKKVDPNVAKLESLIAALQTEREVITEWYAESLELLNGSTEAELEAIGGKHAAMERLEKEHQERLASIKEMGNQWGVQAALEGGAAILGAMASTNKKAAKLQGIFAAAAALMSTYQGAAKELEKGTFGFASAAAVIAKGIGFVSAIKSAASSGASGAPAASGTNGATQAAAPAPLQATLNTFGAGDLVSMVDLGAMLDRLNDAAGDRGYTILRPA